MIIKIICFISVSACGTLIGLEFRRKLFIRLQSLLMCKDVFNQLKSMISYCGLALDDIILEIGNMHPNNKLMTKCSEYIHHLPFKMAWKNALKELSQEMCLGENDVKFLCESAEKLGKSDVDNEVALLELIDLQLSDIIGEAKHKLNSDGKICTALGSACGIITALIII